MSTELQLLEMLKELHNVYFFHGTSPRKDYAISLGTAVAAAIVPDVIQLCQQANRDTDPGPLYCTLCRVVICLLFYKNVLFLTPFFLLMSGYCMAVDKVSPPLAGMESSSGLAF